MMHTAIPHRHVPHMHGCTLHSILQGSLVPLRGSRSLYHQQPHTPPCARTTRHKCLATIGFDLPGASQGKDVERTAGELINSAASLLVYRAVMTTKPSQAFLRLLQYLQRGTAQQLLEAYGDLYNQLALAGHSSWMDYVLEQILLASKNAWAKGLARGDITGPCPLDAAVAYDLDVLQQLSVPESTLVAWIRQVAPSVPEAWGPAALAHTKPTPSRDNGDSGEGSGESVLLSTAQLATPPDLVQLPLDDEDRAAWAAELGARWRWREFAAHLRFYYTTFGHGLMSQYNPVLWSDGKFHAFHTKAADDNPVRYRALTSAPIFEAVRKTYWDNIAAHARGRPANHVSIVGDERSCMTWFLYPDSAPIGTDPPVVRFVKVPAKEATTVMELGRALGEHPRTRFVVVVDTLDMQTANDAYSQLSDVLTGGQSSGWPDNAILVLSVHSAAGGALPAGHPASYVARIPNLRLAMPNLVEAEYLVCVARMLGIEDPNGNAMMVNAMQYGYKMDFTVRTAYEYAMFYFGTGADELEALEDQGGD